MQFTDHFMSLVKASDFVTQLETGVIQMDNSTFTQWDGCFVAGLYNGVLRKVSTRSKAPLAFGSAVHAGIETYLVNGFQVEDALAVAFAKACEEHLDEMGDAKRNTRTLESLLRSYFLEYSRRPAMRFTPMVHAGKPLVEASFAVPLGNVTIANLPGRSAPLQVSVIWTGKIDIVSDYEGMIAPVDHKTTSIMGEKFVDDKERSSQMLGYAFASRYLSNTLFGGKPVYGVRINALAQRTGGFEFKTFNIPYSEWQIAEWQDETLLAFEHLVRRIYSFLETGVASPTRGHCVTKYGKCSYFDACSLMPRMREAMLQDSSYYETSTWSPLND